MKPYFTKYIPVEGEIKEGDKVLLAGEIITWADFVGIGLKKGNSNLVPQKVKLFLCSRDIKLYDEVYNPVTNEYETVVKDLYEGGGKRPDNCTDFQEVEQCKSFKVIGEISKDTIWVKEEDEFDESEVAWRIGIPYAEDVFCSIGDEDLENLYKEFFKEIVVKCPTCGHFH